MYLRFVDHQLAPSTDFDARASDIYSRTRSLPEGMPILLDDRWRPVEPWLTYFRIVAASTDRGVGASARHVGAGSSYRSQGRR